MKNLEQNLSFQSDYGEIKFPMANIEDICILIFQKKKYQMRNLVETTFSVLKRIIGGKVSSKKARKQRREVKLKCICYLIHRFTKFRGYSIFYENFNRAKISCSDIFPQIEPIISALFLKIPECLIDSNIESKLFP